MAGMAGGDAGPVKTGRGEPGVLFQ
jgi:hypothetical protein